LLGVTDTDPEDGWRIDDEVIRLRPLDGSASFELPGDGELVLGADASCELQLVDPTRRVSRRHARLFRDRGAWWVADLESRNGVRQDGEPRLLFQLVPGTEVTLGGVTLVAESARLVALRAVVARFIGWDDARAGDVDRALRGVREMALRRCALVLRGPGELGAVARRIHAEALGVDRPFEIADAPLISAFERAGTGTLCLRGRASAEELAALRRAFESPQAHARIIACASSSKAASEIASLLGRSVVVDLPPLATRRDELARVLEAFAEDAARELTAPRTGLLGHEMNWLGRIEFDDFEDVEGVIRRVVAIRNWGVTEAARRLGITHSALSQWAQRLGIPT
jgi:hypothetical protein